jgi:hypothetical protein
MKIRDFYRMLLLVCLVGCNRPVGPAFDFCGHRGIVGGLPTCADCPGDDPGKTCHPQYTGPCRRDGERIEGKLQGEVCCNHTAAHPRGFTIAAEELRDGSCIAAPPSIMICSICGDKVCQPWENRCNCPADCSSSL